MQEPMPKQVVYQEPRLPAVEEMWNALGFDQRQMDEIRWAQTYAASFRHGTDGHQKLLLIAQLTGALTRAFMTIDTIADPQAAREALAELAHEQWVGWMRYMFSKSQFNDDGTVTIPEWAVDRWKRQVRTPYPELSDQEKSSDRTEADKVLALLFGRKEEANAD
jgi:hypothetical protein